MSNPQQPELARSRKTPSQDQDAVAGIVEGQRDVGASAPRGPVPPENQPGNHPEREQDKPDLDAFAAKFGVADGNGADQEDAAQPSRESVAEKVAASGSRLKSSKSALFALAAALTSALAAVVGLVLNRKRRQTRGR